MGHDWADWGLAFRSLPQGDIPIFAETNIETILEPHNSGLSSFAQLSASLRSRGRLIHSSNSSGTDC